MTKQKRRARSPPFLVLDYFRRTGGELTRGAGVERGGVVMRGAGAGVTRGAGAGDGATLGAGAGAGFTRGGGELMIRGVGFVAGGGVLMTLGTAFVTPAGGRTDLGKLFVTFGCEGNVFVIGAGVELMIFGPGFDGGNVLMIEGVFTFDPGLGAGGVLMIDGAVVFDPVFDGSGVLMIEGPGFDFGSCGDLPRVGPGVGVAAPFDNSPGLTGLGAGGFPGVFGACVPVFGADGKLGVGSVNTLIGNVRTCDVGRVLAELAASTRWRLVAISRVCCTTLCCALICVGVDFTTLTGRFAT